MEKNILKYWLKQAKEFEQIGSFGMGVLVVLFIVIGSGYLFYKAHTLGPASKLFPSFESATPTPTSQPAQQNQQRIHTVKKSEGLWQIAQQYYNDGNQYMKIYEANKDKMRTPEDVSEGMQLVIP